MLLHLHLSIAEMVWVAFGFLGQGAFSARFIIQWWASEKARKTVIPVSFWTLSIIGSLILSIYAIYRKDPVFILGQLPSVFVYARNIFLNNHMEEPHIEAGEIQQKT